MSAILAGSENTTWKYGTGNSSASRSASHSRAAAPWALRAMPVAAGVVGNLGVAAVLVLAACDMPSERCRAAALDRRHHLELAEADMAGIGLPPCRSVDAKNIRDLQRRAGHDRGLLRRRLVLLSRVGLLARLLARL